MPVIMKDNVQYAYTTKGTVFHTLSNAEYEALPESEKMNGDVYCIPDREPILNPDQVWAKIGTETLDIGDDLTDGVNQLNSSLTDLTTYSESIEKVIGEWVNGKPLYRLVVSGTTHATAGTIKALKTFSDYADLEIKNIYGTIKSSAADAYYTYLPCNYYESSSSYAYTFMRGSDRSLSVKTTYQSRPIEVVIEYTRVSD